MKNTNKIDPKIEKGEKLTEIGLILQETRIKKSLSLERIAQETRIPLRLLKAIENGDLDSLPEDVYIRAFIKEFADYLGLKGDELGREFPVYSSLRSTKRYFWIKLPSLQLRPIHLYFLYILLVLVSVRSIAQIIQPTNNLQVIQIETDSKPDSETNKPTPPQVTDNSKPTTQTNPPPTAVTQKPPAEKPKSVTVEVKIEDQSWIRVVVDGKTEFEGIVSKGTQKTWVANQQLTIRAGNAGGVLVSFNEEEAKHLGQRGQVQEVTYKANKITDPSS